MKNGALVMFMYILWMCECFIECILMKWLNFVSSFLFHLDLIYSCNDWVIFPFRIHFKHVSNFIMLSVTTFLFCVLLNWQYFCSLSFFLYLQCDLSCTYVTFMWNLLLIQIEIHPWNDRDFIRIVYLITCGTMKSLQILCKWLQNDLHGIGKSLQNSNDFHV